MDDFFLQIGIENTNRIVQEAKKLGYIVNRICSRNCFISIQVIQSEPHSHLPKIIQSPKTGRMEVEVSKIGFVETEELDIVIESYKSANDVAKLINESLVNNDYFVNYEHREN